MSQQPTQSRSKRRPVAPDDTASLSLSKVERRQLGMDAWEPSLLRRLLALAPQAARSAESAEETQLNP